MSLEQVLYLFRTQWQLVHVFAVEECIIVLQCGKTFEVLVKCSINIFCIDNSNFVLPLNFELTFKLDHFFEKFSEFGYSAR